MSSSDTLDAGLVFGSPYAVPLLSMLTVIISLPCLFRFLKMSFVISYNFVVLLLSMPMIISNIFRPFSC
ncbi:hypothetical protein C8R48DRAFT_708615, partial [Suillus tomentosus]